MNDSFTSRSRLPWRAKAGLVLLTLAGCGGGSPANTPPVANAGSAQAAIAKATITLDGSSSVDADNDTLTYAWAFTSRPAGSAAQLVGPTSVKPTFVPDLAGTYAGTLTVNDGKASSAPATFSVTVSAYGPATALVAESGNNQSVLQHQRADVFRVKVQDALGNPVPGISVTFSALVATAFNASITVQSFADGIATATIGDADAWIRYFHTAGPQQIRASAPGIPELTFQIAVTPTAHLYDGRYYCNDASFASIPIRIENGAVLSDVPLSAATVNESTGALTITRGSGSARTGYSGQIAIDASAHAALSGTYGDYTFDIPTGPSNPWTCNRL